MAQLSYIDTTATRPTSPSLQIPTDESIGAFLFDVSGFNKPFESYQQLYHNFKDNRIKSIKNMEDASVLGITDNGFMNGLLYYHLSQFYNFLGGDQAVYIVIADCTESWDVLQYMQRQVSGRLFHIGIWTTQPIWKLNGDGAVGFTTLITDIQEQANEINGRVGYSTHTMTPLSLILCGNSNYVDGLNLSYKNLPDALTLNCPKVSVILAQNGTDAVHQMQKELPNKAPVSALGVVMACMAYCGAEESIASRAKCNLNKNEEFAYPEWGIGVSGSPINTIPRIWANITSSKGYIIPIDHAEMEASYFLSSDQTLSEGNYRTIANNRVMHKCRRAVGTALAPYINSDHIYTPGSRNIDNSSVAMITDSINTILDSVMRNRTGQSQIRGRTVTFIENTNMLNDDAIALKLDIVPANYSEYISEQVEHNID